MLSHSFQLVAVMLLLHANARVVNTPEFELNLQSENFSDIDAILDLLVADFWRRIFFECAADKLFEFGSKNVEFIHSGGMTTFGKFDGPVEGAGRNKESGASLLEGGRRTKGGGPREKQEQSGR